MSSYTAAIATAIRKGSCVLTGDEAADLERDLTEYEDERARLRAELDRLTALYNTADAEAAKHRGDAADLRAALRECVTTAPESAVYNTGRKTRRLQEINRTARAALDKP